jgi:hypothetical protein
MSKADFQDFNIPADAAPQQVFDNLSAANQNKYFGKVQADEIRNGRSVTSSVNRSKAGMSKTGSTSSDSVRKRLDAASGQSFPSDYQASANSGISGRQSLFARAEARRAARQ